MPNMMRPVPKCKCGNPVRLSDRWLLCLTCGGVLPGKEKKS